MSDFSQYKNIKIARVASLKDFSSNTSAATVVSQESRREFHYAIANATAAAAEAPISLNPVANGHVVSAQLTVSAASVANNTDYNIFTIGKRTNGGAVSNFAVCNLQNTATTAFVPVSFVITAANQTFSTGDCFTLVNAKTGNGLANNPVAVIDIVTEDDS